MSISAFYIPSYNLFGTGSVSTAIDRMIALGFKRAFVVTDEGMVKSGIAPNIVEQLKAVGLNVAVFDGVKPNPNVSNVNAGLALLKAHNADVVVSLGGGSSHDCAKGIALLATNGGKIEDYEGVDCSAKAQLPLVAINTTAGTASEMTRFCIITDDTRHVKMAIVDQNVTPIVSVNDPDLMKGMPKGLTAATGMDALTHAIEAYVSVAANPITDACALKAVTLICENLEAAVSNGQDMHARDQMAYAQYLAGMAFNNASLGYVHAMAHQLGGFYDLPHGVCNAVLLPHVQRFNAQAASARLSDVAVAMGIANPSAEAAIVAIQQLAEKVGIPRGLSELGVKADDIPVLAINALKDACGLTNPIQANQAQIEAIFQAAM